VLFPENSRNSSAGSIFAREFGTQSGNAVFLLRNIHCFDFVGISRGNNRVTILYITPGISQPKKALFGVSDDLKSPLRFACEIVCT
jgi:hypothetical protein